MVCTALRASSIGVPHANGFGVRREAFGRGERLDDWRDFAEAVARYLLHGDNFHEVERAESTAITRDTASGQGVIRASGVVAERLRGIVTDEDGACRGDVVEVFARYGDVLG